MDDLIKDYKITLKQINKARFAANEEDKKILGSCADSVTFAIDYMVKGKHPENRRSITRRSGVQRETPVDPKNVDFIKAVALQRKAVDSLSIEQKELLDDLLGILTTKERDAYIMVRGNGYSFGDAAELLQVAKGTVQNLVARAEEKIAFVVQKGKSNGEQLKEPVQRTMFIENC